MLIGIDGAVIVKLVVYIKGKYAKKYCKGIEYGSVRFAKTSSTSTKFSKQCAVHRQTKHLTMNRCLKQSKCARNKNILVIGGYGETWFCVTELNANAQQLCCYRPERHRLNRVRKALVAGRLQDKSAEYH